MHSWLSHRDSVVEENKKFLVRLTKQNHKEVVSKADSIHDEVFMRIDCLQCANCCKSIPPIVNQTDSRRIANYLQLSESQFYQKYLLKDEDGDTVINQSPCPFLEPDNKCRIYEVRPKACREYPHTNNREFIKNIRLHIQNTHYCPAVFHIVEQLKTYFK
ncbi:MAG: YkgJ family cysteine cluster protein [Bacteroidales bacterium]|nr:YkgJ family cysteine cluster protein [Bacteroidales bacterium]